MKISTDQLNRHWYGGVTAYTRADMNGQLLFFIFHSLQAFGMTFCFGPGLRASIPTPIHG